MCTQAIATDNSLVPSLAVWEAAYRRFETPQQEVRKFRQRLEWFGAKEWPKDWQIVDLFCGRGNGLVALEQMGFTRLEGVDLSPRLLAEYGGTATMHHADCRKLPLEDNSRDLVTIHGGLHHLERIPDDLEAVLSEVSRILRPSGMLAIVEPWQTPFLSLVHAACEWRLLRRAWAKLDALATMIEHERGTYQNWLLNGATVKHSLLEQFDAVRQRQQRGKLWFLGRKRP